MKKHPLSILGMALTTISAVLFLFVYLADAFGLHTNPYMGIVFFLIMPAFFIAGLVMIPIFLLDNWLRFEWLPLVPIFVQALIGLTLVYTSVFVYRLYRSLL